MEANRRLGTDPRPVRGHDLPIIAPDPSDANHLVEFDFDYVNESCDANVSFDAGATWTPTVLKGPAGFPAPYCHINNNHRGGRPAHSSVAFGSPGNVYTTFASENSDGSDTIGVLKSTDGGRSFAPSVVAMPAVHAEGGTPGIDYRRPQLAVVASPQGDTVYVAGWACTLDAPFGRCASVAFVSSLDGARTFTAPATVNTPDPAKLDADFDNSQPVVRGNTISIAYRHNHRTNPSEPNLNRATFEPSLQLATSTDGGTTWSASTIRPTFSPARGFVDPVLAADPNDGTLYVTYEEKTDSVGQPPNTQSVADIFIQHSSDRGKTWSAPTRVNDDPAGFKINHWQPWVSVTRDGRVDVTWFDQRNAYPGANLQDVYYASSPGKDAPYTANRRITDRTNNRDLGYTNQLGTFPPVNTAINGGVLVAWGDTRDANFDSNVQDIELAKVVLHTGTAPPVRTLGASGLAVALSQLAYPGGSDYVGTKTLTKVVVVNDKDGAAALAAAVLARANYGPLLTSPAGGLPKQVSDEIKRIRPIGAYVIGSPTELPNSVSAAVGAAAGSGDVSRLAGKDPADTARLIAQAMDGRSDADKAAAKPAFGAAVIVNPASPEALAAGQTAASFKMPILFVDRDTIPPATSDALRSLGITKSLVVGAATSVSDAVTAKLPGGQRASGSDVMSVAATLGGTRTYPPSAGVVYVGSSGRAVDAALLAAEVSRLNGTVLLVPGAKASTAVSTLNGTPLGSTVDRIVVAAPPSSTSRPWLRVVVGLSALLAVAGLALLLLARRRPPPPVSEPA